MWDRKEEVIVIDTLYLLCTSKEIYIGVDNESHNEPGSSAKS